jgi:hypothetical protein
MGYRESRVDLEVPEQVENFMGKGDNCLEVADPPL